MKKTLTTEQTEKINNAFALISKDEISTRELDQYYKTKKHIDPLWLIKMRLWENKIKNLNEQKLIN